MCFYTIAAKYNGPLEAAHAYIDNFWYFLWRASAGQIKFDFSEHDPAYSYNQSKWAVLIYIGTFTYIVKYIDPLEVAHVYDDEDRYDMVQWAAASQPT